MYSKFRRLFFLTILGMAFVSYAIADLQPINKHSIQKELAKLEADSGGRIGLFAINTANNTQWHYRSKERFPMCSTSKVMAVSAILKQSMHNKHLLQQKIIFNKNDVDLSGFAPITQQHISTGMSIGELCKAAITHSDNAAMNLLMKALGGLDKVTAFAHLIGDNTFILERWEPQLNLAISGDLRDTTTPFAMGQSLKHLALGNSLAKRQREQLKIWLKGNTTGNARIRAGVFNNWVVGDKTGTGEYVL